MKNNNGKGIYDVGERHRLSCGCVEVAQEIGYTLYVQPGCKFCDTWHPNIPRYHYHHEDPAGLQMVADAQEADK